MVWSWCKCCTWCFGKDDDDEDDVGEVPQPSGPKSPRRQFVPENRACLTSQSTSALRVPSESPPFDIRMHTRGQSFQAPEPEVELRALPLKRGRAYYDRNAATAAIRGQAVQKAAHCRSDSTYSDLDVAAKRLGLLTSPIAGHVNVSVPAIPTSGFPPVKVPTHPKSYSHDGTMVAIPRPVAQRQTAAPKHVSYKSEVSYRSDVSYGSDVSSLTESSFPYSENSYGSDIIYSDDDLEVAAKELGLITAPIAGHVNTSTLAVPTPGFPPAKVHTRAKSYSRDTTMVAASKRPVPKPVHHSPRQRAMAKQELITNLASCVEQFDELVAMDPRYSDLPDSPPAELHTYAKGYGRNGLKAPVPVQAQTKPIHQRSDSYYSDGVSDMEDMLDFVDTSGYPPTGTQRYPDSYGHNGTRLAVPEPAHTKPMFQRSDSTCSDLSLSGYSRNGTKAAVTQRAHTKPMYQVSDSTNPDDILFAAEMLGLVDSPAPAIPSPGFPPTEIRRYPKSCSQDGTMVAVPEQAQTKHTYQASDSTNSDDLLITANMLGLSLPMKN